MPGVFEVTASDVAILQIGFLAKDRAKALRKLRKALEGKQAVKLPSTTECHCEYEGDIRIISYWDVIKVRFMFWADVGWTS